MERGSREHEVQGAKPTDPPLMRLLFVLVEGRSGQWWRATVLLLTGSVLVGMLAVAVALLFATGWLGGVIGASTVGGVSALISSRRKRSPPL